MLLHAILASIAPVIALPSPVRSVSATDTELVTLALEGNQSARRELYLRHVRTVAARVIRLVANRADADDAIQDTFFEAFRDLGRLKEPSRFPAWVMRISVHQAHRRLRHRRLLRRLGFDSNTDEATLESLVAPNADPEIGSCLAKLDRILRDIDTDLRVTWMLRMVEGCELSEIAELCGCSVATVKRRLATAKERIANHFDCLPLKEAEE